MVAAAIPTRPDAAAGPPVHRVALVVDAPRSAVTDPTADAVDIAVEPAANIAASDTGPEPTVDGEAPPLGPCADALATAALAGLPLPAGVGYHCPSTEFAHHGAACWNGPYCPGTGFIAINLDLIGGRGTAYVRHVVAHEICHIVDFRATGRSTEASAEACAVRHLALLERP